MRLCFIHTKCVPTGRLGRNTRLHKTFDLLKSGSLVDFRAHQHTGMNIPTYMLMPLTGQYAVAVHMYVCNVPKLRARQYRVSVFPYCCYLAPLTSSAVLACQGSFNEDHFRCQQPHCGRSPAASLTGYLIARWQPLSFTCPIKTSFLLMY